ncbi:MAG TPA: glutathione peroxidase [Bryobacteraceae bacterium]|nr:glutathione peroxidase [Bryobacteraceae bacterium]
MTKLLGAICLMSVAPGMFAANIYDYTVKSIDGQQVPLSTYKGKVVLLVNVASRCGYTPQYTGLEAMYEKYKSQGFVILGFPANNFMSQEPGTDAEIKTFCSTKYNVSFPMFSKISVKGDDKADLYKYLTDQTANPASGGEIKWNFTKFLIDRNGKIVQRFEPAVAPEKFDAAVAAAVK